MFTLNNLWEFIFRLSMTKKLIPNLRSKRGIFVHYRNLKFYLKHGLKLLKIHAIVEFKQSPWMRDFPLGNAEERKKVEEGSFKHKYYKNKTNQAYGKSKWNMVVSKIISL